MTARQGACCMLLQPFADGDSPALLFLPPLSLLVLSPSQASCSPCQRGRCCEHSFEACCHNGLGSGEEWLLKDASPVPVALSYTRLHSLHRVPPPVLPVGEEHSDSGRAGGLEDQAPAPVRGRWLPDGGSQQKPAVFWQECGIFVLLHSEGSCPMWVIIKDLLFIINEWGQQPQHLCSSRAVSCYSVSLSEYCFCACGIKLEQSYLKVFSYSFYWS